MTPLVSVVIATHNRPTLVAQTIESVLNQSYANLEVLLIGDGPQEEAARFVSYRSDPRLRYIEAPHSGRPAIPRNIGIRHSKGPLVAFCDDDDLWLPNKLQSQISYMVQHNVDFTYTECSFIDERGREMATKPPRPKRHLTKFDLLTSLGGLIVTPTVILKRELIERAGLFDESPELRTGEDYELFSRLLMHSDAHGIPEALVLVRIHRSIQPRRLGRWLAEQHEIQSAIWRNGTAPLWIWLTRYCRVWYWCLRVICRDPLRRSLSPVNGSEEASSAD